MDIGLLQLLWRKVVVLQCYSFSVVGSFGGSGSSLIVELSVIAEA